MPGITEISSMVHGQRHAVSESDLNVNLEDKVMHRNIMPETVKIISRVSPPIFKIFLT
jgi:hypothetical protein